MQSLQRPRDEPLEKALARLRAKTAPAPSKKDKRRQGKPSEEPLMAQAASDPSSPSTTIALYLDLSSKVEVHPSTLGSQAWREGRVLQVGDELFSIVYNPPMVTGERGLVMSSKRVIVGMPLTAHPYLLFADKDLSRFKWEVRAANGGSGSGSGSGHEPWVEVEGAAAGGAVYRPSIDDLGKTLRVTCTPARRRSAADQGGDEEDQEIIVGESTSVESNPVEAGPEASVLSIRGPHRRPLNGDQRGHFRVMSYNILADQYAGSNYAQKVLFDYCPPRCLEPEYRKTLTAAELELYDADLVCLQEVDERAFHEHYLPLMESRGFSGRYTSKMGKVREGSATFWRDALFTEVARDDLRLRDVFEAAASDPQSMYKPLLDASPSLKEALGKVTTIAQVTILQVKNTHEGQEQGIKGQGEGVEQQQHQEQPQEQEDKSAMICIANTHLFFHPYAPHIRTIHTCEILHQSHRLIQSLPLLRDGGTRARPPALLFCGDLNSDLNDGIPGSIELLQGGALPSTHWDWSQGAAFRWGMEEGEGSEEQQANAPKPPGGELAAKKINAPASLTVTAESRPSPSKASVSSVEGVGVVGVDLVSPFGALRSADDLKTPFSNYTSGYKALLDYCWYEPGRMEVVEGGGVSVPHEREMEGFIPNRAFPSDHLAVIYDLKLL